MITKSIKSISMLTVTSIIFVLLSSFSFSTSNPEDKILGNWYCEALDKSHFKVIKEQNGLYSAIITKSEVASYVGKKAMKDVKYNTKEKKWEGTIISVKRNQELDAVFNLQNENNLKVVGSIFLFSKTFYWVRK